MSCGPDCGCICDCFYDELESARVVVETFRNGLGHGELCNTNLSPGSTRCDCDYDPHGVKTLRALKAYDLVVENAN